MSEQTSIFERDEGDHWFARNASKLNDGSDLGPVGDAVAALSASGAGMATVAELGCANGWRLAALRASYPEIETAYGRDVSAAAIADGTARWPGIDLAVAPLDAPALPRPVELVIVSFVLHWVGRSRLDASLEAIIDAIQPGGHLVMADFLPDEPCARDYHHRTDADLKTFKQDYARDFIERGLELQDRIIFSHGGHTGDAIDPNDRATCVTLRKPGPPVR